MLKVASTLLVLAGLHGVSARAIADDVVESSDRLLSRRARDVGTPLYFRAEDNVAPYGKLIEQCANEGQIAITFDDGPSQYTQRVLEEFAKYEEDGFKATFFVTGNNICPITGDECAETIRSVLKAGHQIASHTWHHEDLDAISKEGRAEQMNLNKDALAKAMDMDGKAPTYMRPPYGTCSEGTGCLKDLGDMGYHVVNWNVDTVDWQHCTTEDGCMKSVALFDELFDSQSRIGYTVLTHDIKEFTPSILLPHILKRAKEANYKVVTVGECLNDPKENWYKKW